MYDSTRSDGRTSDVRVCADSFDPRQVADLFRPQRHFRHLQLFLIDFQIFRELETHSIGPYGSGTANLKW